MRAVNRGTLSTARTTAEPLAVVDRLKDGLVQPALAIVGTRATAVAPTIEVTATPHRRRRDIPIPPCVDMARP